MNKILWFDVETTGLDPVTQDIVQLAGMIEIDGKIQNEFNFKLRPFSFETIDLEALEIIGVTVEELKEYPDPAIAFQEFTGIMESFVDKFDKNDKLAPAGYNVGFDIKFLQSFYGKCNYKYLYSFISGYSVDVYEVVKFYAQVGALPVTENLKLGTVARALEIEIDAHEAMSDIRATREIYLKLKAQVNLFNAIK